VKRLNAITAQLESLDVVTAPVVVINGLKREELIASNSMILHELYFDGLGSQGEPDKKLSNALTRDFGTRERWQAQFVAMGKALGGGSGWVLLTYSDRDTKLVNQWAADHTCCLAGASPILALDMYEHSYHMDYGAAAGAYVDAYMNNINWQNASALYEQNAR
jgi:Fe-Mn family superoxide dismutase